MRKSRQRRSVSTYHLHRLDYRGRQIEEKFGSVEYAEGSPELLGLVRILKNRKEDLVGLRGRLWITRNMNSGRRKMNQATYV